MFLKNTQVCTVVTPNSLNSIIRTIRKVRECLENLPEEIYKTYDDAVFRIRRQEEEDKNLGMTVLQLITSAFRLLSMRELLCAAAVYPSDKDFDAEGMVSEEKLLSVCAGLVAVDREGRNSIVRLIRE